MLRGRPGDDQDQRDLDGVLTPIVVWVCLAAVFSELVSIYLYIYDVFLMIPAVLLVFVHGPLLVARYYRHQGVIALSVLLGALWYVWSSLATYSALSARLPVP